MAEAVLLEQQPNPSIVDNPVKEFSGWLKPQNPISPLSLPKLPDHLATGIHDLGTERISLDRAINKRGHQRFQDKIPVADRIKTHALVLATTATLVFGSTLLRPPTNSELKQAETIKVTEKGQQPIEQWYTLVEPTVSLNKTETTLEKEVTLDDLLKNFSKADAEEIKWKITLRNNSIEHLTFPANQEKYTRIYNRASLVTKWIDKLMPEAKDKSYWKTLVLGVQAAELENGLASEVNKPKKESDANKNLKTIGVGQFTIDTALKLVQKYAESKNPQLKALVAGVNEKNIEEKLKDQEFSTGLQLQYLSELVKNYDDTTLGVFAYNTGIGTTNRLIEAFLFETANKLKATDEKAYLDLSVRIIDAYKNPDLSEFNRLIKEYKVNPKALLDSPAVQILLIKMAKEGNPVNLTEIQMYYINVLAGYGRMQEIAGNPTLLS